MKYSFVAAALVGSVLATQHNAHGAFHARRGGYEAKENVCTVYTTVYETAVSSPPAAPSTAVPTVPVYTPVVPVSVQDTTKPTPASSTSCTEEKEAHPTAPAPVYSPAPKPEAPAPKPETPAPKPEAPAPKPVSSAQAYPTKPAEAPKPAASSSHQVADKPKPTGGYSSGDRIKVNGDKWAMTYTPYAKDGQCKTADEIKSDIKKISELGFTTIRSYSTDCGVFESVVPECQKYGLKVIYGIFLEGAGKGTFSQYAENQLNDIKNKAPKDSVSMVIVGNECMFKGNCQPAELASYIDHVRDVLRGAGFPQDIAITTTEPVGTWEEKGAVLCDHIDIFTVQVHPYFTQSVTADQAGDFAAQQLEQAAKVCPGPASKGKYISEIGWPSAGTNNGKAIAGFFEQKIAMKKIMEKVGSESCLFSFQNDLWKPAGALNVEQNFGILPALS